MGQGEGSGKNQPAGLTTTFQGPSGLQGPFGLQSMPANGYTMQGMPFIPQIQSSGITQSLPQNGSSGSFTFPFVQSGPQFFSGGQMIVNAPPKNDQSSGNSHLSAQDSQKQNANFLPQQFLPHGGQLSSQGQFTLMGNQNSVERGTNHNSGPTVPSGVWQQSPPSYPVQSPNGSDSKSGSLGFGGNVLMNNQFDGNLNSNGNISNTSTPPNINAQHRNHGSTSSPTFASANSQNTMWPNQQIGSQVSNGQSNPSGPQSNQSSTPPIFQQQPTSFNGNGGLSFQNGQFAPQMAIVGNSQYTSQAGSTQTKSVQSDNSVNSTSTTSSTISTGLPAQQQMSQPYQIYVQQPQPVYAPSMPQQQFVPVSMGQMGQVQYPVIYAPQHQPGMPSAPQFYTVSVPLGYPGQFRDDLRGSSRKERKRSSKYKGVSWHKRGKKWIARIWINGKSEHLGVYSSEMRAALAVDLRLIELGESAQSLNFPEDSVRTQLLNSFKGDSSDSGSNDISTLDSLRERSGTASSTESSFSSPNVARAADKKRRAESEPEVSGKSKKHDRSHVPAEKCVSNSDSSRSVSSVPA